MKHTTTMRRAAAAWLAAAALGAVGSAQAQCLDDAQIQAWVTGYLEKTPVDNPPGDLSAADGACTRAKFNAALAQRLGKVVGYKAGLTNPAVQKRFNTDQPVWGKLYEGMLLPNGATVPARFGARPLFEADLLLRVADPAALKQARTPEQALAAMDQLIPFMELPDLLVQAPPKLNGAGVSAINVGARLGVAGEPLAVPQDEAGRTALLQQLKAMEVTLSDAQGKELGRGKGSDVLEHPLNAVLWLVQALGAEGIELKQGDVLSVGSFSPLLPPVAGQSAELRYEGLAGAQPVRVRFE
ncbi:2-keto-4-pentenoate hydratase [Vandammella animalimorsus]